MQGCAPAPFRRAVDDIVNHQRNIVEEFDHNRGGYDLFRYRPRDQGPVASEDGQGPKILRSGEELPLQRLAHLEVAALDPRGDPLPQNSHLVGEPESGNDVAARLSDGGANVHGLTS